ncbi:HlyD family secretion protein [Adhaeretor mobilis]|uniref:HlyD family secretion protein n=2 Tax=Adhaeretor mobilis TaxID=1930276 RepID=A0A517N1N5_9BACT|nr:HlyD family secretion protein [Adhaeretor mobilis]
MPEGDDVNRAKQEIQSLVQEVVELSKSDVETGEFYAGLLDRAVAALAAMGGVVWSINETTGFKLEYQSNLRQSGLADNPAAQMQHARLLEDIAKKGQPTLVAPHSGAGGEGDDDHVAANPTDFLLVVAPISTDRGVDGLVEVFQRPGARPTTQRGYLKFLVQLCELAGEYLKTRRLRHFATKQTLWEQLESFTSQVHEHLNSRETAYTIANEGRRLIGCDRVTVVLKKGAKYVVESISGQDTFDKRSNVVRLLRNLSKVVCKSGEDLWYTGDTSDLAPQVEKAVNAYVDESHTKQLSVLPLREADPNADDKENRRKKENILGAIIIEQLVDSRAPDGLMQRVDVVKKHSATSLTNAQSHEGLFLLPLWRFIGKSRVLTTARNLPKTILATIVLAGLITAACLVPYEFTMVADGQLMPEVRRNVFAGLDGTIEEVNVSLNSTVKQGDIVAEMRSTDLESETAALDGEVEKTAAEIASTKKRIQMMNDQRARPSDAERAQVEGEKKQLQTVMESYQEQRRLLNKKRENLIVRSPIGGKVVTWRVEERLKGRPVRKGQQLMEVADPSQRWELEIFVPETKMGHVIEQLQKLRKSDPNAKLQLTFILATHPSEKLAGTVEEIHTTAEISGDKGNTVRMTVSFDQQQLTQQLGLKDVANDLKVGQDVKAKIDCGKQPVGYVIFHDLFEFIQSRILFRL